MKKTKKTNKLLTTMLSAIMVFCLFIICSTVSFAADIESGVMKSYASSSTDDYHGYKNDVVSITFLDKIDYESMNAADTFKKWDVSEAGDGSVMAWAKRTPVNNLDIYIASNEGIIIANPNSSYLFANFTNLKEINGLKNLDTSTVTNMDYMFYQCISLTSLDVSKFDTFKVTTMYFTFAADTFSNDLKTQLKSLDLSTWNTLNVTDMSYMFYNNNGIEELNLKGWNSLNVLDMSCMFESCTNLKSLNINEWHTPIAINMYRMFWNCKNLTNLNLSDFDTQNARNMKEMFYRCSSLTSLDLSNFNTSKVTNMENMFGSCYELTSINLNKWNTAKVTNMKYMFKNCINLAELDISNFDTSKVTDMTEMFYNCNRLQTIYVSDNWTVEHDPTGVNMFKNCTNLIGQTGFSYDSSKNGRTYAKTKYYLTHIDTTLVPEIPPINDNDGINSDNINNNTTKLSFFEQLIQFIKNLFAKLFG